MATESVEREVPAAPDSGRLYFPELDGLRFVAFLLVFLFHQGVPWGTLATVLGRDGARCFRENGWVGVQLFFILSGYLITTLLLREEANYGRVALRAFWVRRILRIWPLFYLTILITFGLVPLLSGAYRYPEGRAELTKHLPAFLAFLGNWSMITRGPVTFDCQSVLWSVCVEEQFYLVVPLVVAFVPRRARIPLVLLAIAGAVFTRGRLAYAEANQLAIQYNTFAQFDTLLSGVLLALVLGSAPKDRGVERWLKWAQWPLYVLTLWVFTRSNLGHGLAWRRTWDFVAIWLVGVGLVAVAATVPGWPGRALAHPRVVRLGQISYGLYMYHEVAFWIRNEVARYVGWFPFENWIWPVLTLGLTIQMARLSYDRFERPFLRLKKVWTRVESRPLD